MTQIKHKLINALMVCLGLEPGVAGWKAYTNPLNYGGTPKRNQVKHGLQYDLKEMIGQRE